MKKLSLLVFSLFFTSVSLLAQMTINGQELYGNEWINHSQDYYKLYVTDDGMYRITPQALLDAGVPLSSINAGDFSLYAMGREVPIYTSSNGTLGANDFIEFYGEKNDGEMDEHLYASKDEHFNPFYSMFTDTTTYFLTWGGSNNGQFQETPNDLANLPAAEPYFIDNAVKFYNSKYNKGTPYGGLYESRFSTGEGFGDAFRLTGSHSVTVNNAYTSGPDATLRIRFASQGGGASHIAALAVNAYDVPIDSSNFYSYLMRQITEDIPMSSLANGANVISLSGSAGTADQYAVSFAMISYPREFKFGNADNYNFNLPASSGKKYLEINDFNHGGVAPILYDFTNKLRITTTLSGNTVRVTLPASSTDRELMLISQNYNYTNIDVVDNANFVDYTAEQGDFIIISNPLLFDDGNGINYVQEYADYRAATGYDPIIITTEQLYDQFGYGVSRHSQAVRNITGYTLANWSPQPKYMFMIGKSRPFYSVRKNWPKQPAFTTTFGHEPSDVLLTATTENDTPRIPFGKLPATRGEQIGVYLRKVITYENVNATLPQTIEDKAWRKRVLHLGGGNATIQTTIKNNLGNYEDVVTDQYYGADVVSFIENSSEPTTGSATQLLDSLISDGTSLITFYGHSTTSNIDFNIGFPEEYNNQDKYPVFFSLGCFSGQIHTKAYTMSEQFVFAEDRGSIAFLASVALSSLGALDVFADSFYEKMTINNYGQGLGDIVQAAIADLSTDLNVYNRIVYQQMTINGDPSIRINTDQTPDYLVNESNISFGPEEPNNTDDITIDFSVVNLGMSENNQFNIKIEQVLPDGTVVVVVDELVDAPSFEEAFSYTIPAIPGAVGLNQFIITVDSEDVVVEMPTSSEANNTSTAELYIYANVVTPISPTNYGIAPDQDVTLTAQINELYADQNLTYYFEIDTTENFNSPLLETTSIQQTGGTLEWTPNLTHDEETVYYWRVRVAPSQVPNADDWQDMSYVYVEGEYPGWNQSHHYQFMDDRYPNTMVYNEDTRMFEYVNSSTEVVINAAQVGVLPSSQIDFSIGGSRIHDVDNCEYYTQGIYVVLLDENNEPIMNDIVDLDNSVGEYGSFTCRETLPVYTFPTDDAAGQQTLEDFLNNELPNIPGAENMIIYTLNDYLPETWSPSLHTAFDNVGATDMPMTEGAPYAALIDLNTGEAQQETGTTEDDIIQGVFAIQDPWYTGSMFSTPIGPASEWGSVHWGATDVEDADETHINVYGIDADGNRVLLVEDLTANDHIFDTSVVDASMYPYIQLEYVTTDEVNQTPAQLDFWRVIFESSACFDIEITAMLEGAYNTSLGLMNTTLSSDRKLLPGQTPLSNLVSPTPAGQPYSTAPWNYAGDEGINYTDADYTGSEVDWVLVSLRTGLEKSEEVAVAAGLLMKDGSIRFDGECPLTTTATGPFYILVEHRNHMGAMSHEAIPATNGKIVYDFSLRDSYRTAASFGQKEIAPGVWAMFAGDLNPDDGESYDITGADKNVWSADNGKFDIYLYGDANLDGDSNGADKILWEKNNGNSSRVPR